MFHLLVKEIEILVGTVDIFTQRYSLRLELNEQKMINEDIDNQSNLNCFQCNFLISLSRFSSIHYFMNLLVIHNNEMKMQLADFMKR